MKSKENLIKICKILFLFFVLAFIFNIDILKINAEQTDEAYLISIKGTIDLGLASYVERSLIEADENDAKIIILEIDTLGGRVDAALQIRDRIIGLNIPSIAFVKNRAWSAGALISLSAQYIIMDKSASIGAAEPRPADIKTISALRAEFASTAISRGRSGIIASAMVDKDIEIPDIIEKDKILTLSAKQALELKLIDGITDNIQEALNVINFKNLRIKSSHPNWAENLSRFVTNPIVSPLLLSIGFLGLVIEFWTLGWGIAGTIGIVSLSLFFGGHVLVGLAGWEAVVLFLVGIFLLLAEIFIIPGFGLAGISGIVAMVASIFLALGNIIQATYSILIALGVSILGFFLLIRYLPSTRTWKRFILSTQQKKELGYTVGSDTLNKLKGKTGRTITPLHPSGIIEVSGQKLNAITSGEYIENNTEIKIISIEGNKVVVEAFYTSDN